MSLWRRMRRWAAIVFLVLLLGPVPLALAYRWLAPPATPLIGLRALEGEGWRQEWRPLAQLGRELPRAVIASEDARFCRHWGFDLVELRAAWATFERTGRLRGASTVSEQTAKNVFLWPGRSWLRKAPEAWLTLVLEALWGKERILEVYLNVIEWGPGVYGAEAAARHWFGKDAARLTRREAALLAAILPNPRRFSAREPTPFIRDRVATIEARMDAVPLGRARVCD